MVNLQIPELSTISQRLDRIEALLDGKKKSESQYKLASEMRKKYNFSRSFMYDQIRKGLFTSHKISNMLYLNETEITNLLERSK